MPIFLSSLFWLFLKKLLGRSFWKDFRGKPIQTEGLFEFLEHFFRPLVDLCDAKRLRTGFNHLPYPLLEGPGEALADGARKESTQFKLRVLQAAGDSYRKEEFPIGIREENDEFLLGDAKNRFQKRSGGGGP